MNDEYELFDYQGEIPKVLTEGDIVSVSVLEDKLSTNVPLYIRAHLVVQDKILQDFLYERSPNASIPSAITKRELYVSGPPGCGKTVFFTLAAHRYAKHDFKKVLMVNFRLSGPCHIFKIHGDVTKKLKKRLNGNNIVNVVDQLMEQDDDEQYDLVILDGVRQKLQACSNLISILNSFTGEIDKVRKVIHTTSLEFNMPTGDKMQGIRSQLIRSNFDSFVEIDYQNAFCNRDFLRRLNQELLMEILQWQQEREKMLEQERTGTVDDEHDSRLEDVDMNESIEDNTETRVEGDDKQEENINMDEAVEDSVSTAVDVDILEDESLQDYVTHKYYYAGGSARFMFEYTADALKLHLDDTAKRLRAAEWEEFADGSVAPGSTHAVNSLMQQFSGQAVAVSRYILFIAYEKAGGKLVQAVQAVADATGNPALKGWGFELRQLEIIKSAIKQSDLHGGAKVVRSKEGLAFRPLSDRQLDYDGSTLKPRGEEPPEYNGTIIWCLKWNQGCFDVAYYRSGTLLTLQFTVSPDHSLKLQYIKALKEAVEIHGSLNVETCVHLGVVGAAANFTDFKFKTPEGGGRSAWDLDFTVNTSKATALFVSKEGQEDSFAATPLLNYEIYTRKRKEANL